MRLLISILSLLISINIYAQIENAFILEDSDGFVIADNEILEFDSIEFSDASFNFFVRNLTDEQIFLRAELTSISGQKAIATKSKKDVASFKLRKGMPIGAKVTLRGNIMYEFLDRLITAALPRVREFQGVKNSGFDGRGNYTLGITEQIIFPEIDIDKINNISGMDITFVTSTNDDSLAKSLLKELGLPFKKN